MYHGWRKLYKNSVTFNLCFVPIQKLIHHQILSIWHSLEQISIVFIEDFLMLYFLLPFVSSVKLLHEIVVVVIGIDRVGSRQRKEHCHNQQNCFCFHVSTATKYLLFKIKSYLIKSSYWNLSKVKKIKQFGLKMRLTMRIFGFFKIFDNLKLKTFEK